MLHFPLLSVIIFFPLVGRIFGPGDRQSLAPPVSLDQSDDHLCWNSAW